jgi:hypothetical protein
MNILEVGGVTHITACLDRRDNRKKVNRELRKGIRLRSNSSYARRQLPLNYSNSKSDRINDV